MKEKSKYKLKQGERIRPDGLYEFRTSRNKRAYSVYGKSVNEMRAKKEELLKKLDNGIKVEKQKCSLNEIAEEYLAYKKKNVEKTTFSTMKYMYDKYVRGDIGLLKISDIRRTTIKDYYSKLLNECKLSITTVSRIDGIIKPMLERAVDDDIILKNPASRVCGEIRRENHITVPKVNVPDPDEVKRFLSFMINNPAYSPTIKNIFICIAGTGGRVSEITACTWDNVDFENNVLHIREGIGYYVDENNHRCRMIKKPKSESGIRDIPMIKAVREALENEKKYQEEMGIEQIGLDGITNFCFLSNRNTPFVRETINYHLKKIINDYNKTIGSEKYTIKLFSTHALRHAFCTALCLSTDDIKAIQTIMGHKDVSISLDWYAAATQKGMRLSMDLFENNLGISEIY